MFFVERCGCGDALTGDLLGTAELCFWILISDLKSKNECEPSQVSSALASDGAAVRDVDCSGQLHREAVIS